MTASNQQLVEAAIEEAWADFVNAEDDRYFGNRSKMDKQMAALRKLVSTIQATDGKCQKLRSALENPTKEMLAAGQNALDDCVDEDWNSVGDSFSVCTTIRSDAAAIVFKAMIAALKEQSA